MRVGQYYLYILRDWGCPFYGIGFGNAARHINIKLTRRELFSERYNYIPVWRFAGLSVSLRLKSAT